MYADKNFKTKKALKDAVARGEKIGVFQPGPFGGELPKEGRVTLEGPWFPEPHKWCANAILHDGFIVVVS